MAKNCSQRPAADRPVPFPPLGALVLSQRPGGRLRLDGKDVWGGAAGGRGFQGGEDTGDLLT